MTTMKTTVAISNMTIMLLALSHYSTIHDSSSCSRISSSMGGILFVNAFSSPHHYPRRRQQQQQQQRDVTSSPFPSSLVQLHMGLYDTPLPPRPDNNNNNNNNMDDSDEQEEETNEDIIKISEITTKVRLFHMEKDGTEQRNLLPRLRRRLDIPGIVGPYYEETDRKVQNVMSKTNCHPMDACWSLEAHRGNVRDAWESISVAQRTLLKEQFVLQDDTDEDDWDTAWKNQMEQQASRENFQERKKAQQQKDEQQRNVRDLLNGGGTPDQPYLPKNSFGPEGLDSDEPWYTG